MMTKVEYSKNKAIVTLDNAPSGLAPGNCELEGFEIAGADKKFYPAKARIAGRTRNVEVWSDQVAQTGSRTVCFPQLCRKHHFTQYIRDRCFPVPDRYMG